jgi:hypothetical protein
MRRPRGEAHQEADAQRFETPLDFLERPNKKAWSNLFLFGEKERGPEYHDV